MSNISFMKKFGLLILLVFVLNILKVTAQDEPFKALFIFNITKLVDWPSDYKQGDFIIKVLGKSEISNHFLGKKVINQAITASNSLSVESIGKCHILFISAEESGQLGTVLSRFKGKPTLIICESPGMCSKGACINFVKKDNKLGIEVSKASIEKQGLKVSSDLISLGTTVD